MTEPKPTGKAAKRQDRQRAALRENLKRRKAQARGRSQTDAERAGEAHDSAGIAPEIVSGKPKG